jgi:hypothetical protein
MRGGKKPIYTTHYVYVCIHSWCSARLQQRTRFVDGHITKELAPPRCEACRKPMYLVTKTYHVYTPGETP